VGVGEGAGRDPFSDPVASNIGKSAMAVALSESWQAGVVNGLAAYHRASFRQTAIWATRSTRVPISQSVDDAILNIGTAGALLKDLVGAPPGSSRAEFFDLGYQWFLLAGRWNSRFETERFISGYVMRHQYPGGRIAGKLGLWFADAGKEVVSGAIGLGVDVGYQAWMDAGNPYLTREQFVGRLYVAGGGSIASFTGGLAGEFIAVSGLGLGTGPAGWVAIGTAIGVAIFWDVAIAPTIYNIAGLNPKRNLTPLQ